MHHAGYLFEGVLMMVHSSQRICVVEKLKSCATAIHMLFTSEM
jgi:hypothetical protein